MKTQLACTAAVLLTANVAFGQMLHPSNANFNRFRGSRLVQVPSYGVGYSAFQPYATNWNTAAGLGSIYSNYYGFRPSYWSNSGRWGGYPWPYANTYATYAPEYYYSTDPGLGLAYSYPGYGFGDYYNPSGSGVIYQADAPVAAYRPATPPIATFNATPTDRATIAVQVPSDAKVWIQGAATNQTGADRTFQSPPLEPGREYSYSVKAQWTENGKTVEQSQDVMARAGERTGVLFLADRGTAKANPN